MGGGERRAERAGEDSGAIARTIFQSTAPCCWCARMLESEVKKITAIEVPSAMRMTCSPGSACAPKAHTRSGTVSAAADAEKPGEEADHHTDAEIREEPFHPRGALGDSHPTGR